MNGGQEYFDFEDWQEYHELDDICRNRHGGEHFSELANTEAHPGKSKQRGEVKTYLAEHPSTTEEISIALDLPYTAVSARMSELKRSKEITPVLDKDGNHLVRLTTHNKRAGVYQLTSKPDPKP